ncbi:hypothetical protein DRH29_02565 [candidate division Kazan bacterium]|uniref:Uncharacterized protein n=1 Tax=candidate division Kazan bacterium TaxID=2202143 RepID=A0A420ZCM1_UNCK3|nr:MAG: hypothetical protein DRH29_02565 [candidate division Kazan bacterium]
MRGCGYVALIVVLLGVVFAMRGGCPSGVSINRANYEEHGIYYKGRYLQGVSDSRFDYLPYYGNGDRPPKQDGEIHAAWREHSSSAIQMPRKFILDVYPATGTWLQTAIPYAIDSSDGVIRNPLKDRTVGNKTIGQVEIILHGSGEYVIFDPLYTRRYILIRH